ncbi:MAG: hypothetical protein IJJ28_00500 [Lentisphaeria bacterium]|nr:hypothetical protein [Lentisphaeria bacterium]
MNRKGWLIILLLCSLLLLLGGVHRPKKTDADAPDPVTRGAESLVANAANGTPESWRHAARTNPLWILQIAADTR